jgi:SAM-dependent methyltransferase
MTDRQPAPPRLDLSRRADLELLPELMDGPCSYDELRACLHDIASVNRLTMAYRPTLTWVAGVVDGRPQGSAPLRIVDVGCGFGDMLRRIELWAAKRGVEVALVGIDLNAHAIRAAKDATPAGSRIAWLAGDAYSYRQPVDVVISSLLTHHLPEPEIVRFMRWMEATAQLGWFVNDLHRQTVPYYAFRAMAAVAGWHHFVRHDGPVSIRRSFVSEDWRRICAAAGVQDVATISEWRPARLCVQRVK